MRKGWTKSLSCQLKTVGLHRHRACKARKFLGLLLELLPFGSLLSLPKSFAPSPLLFQ
jgi:hypothetical protein